MDVTEPPQVVWEDPGVCAASAHSEDLVRQALASARAPSAAWVVRIRIDPIGAHGLRAEGRITGADGAIVARRTLSGTAGECNGLAQAVGVWACLVLDTELARSVPAAAGAIGPSTENAATGTGSRDSRASSAPDDRPDTVWPAPAVFEKPPPEHDWYLHHDEERTIELGVGAFLMMGTGANTMVGASPFVVVEAGRGVFLRPSVAVGESLIGLVSAGQATWAAGRFDTCLRLPGLYTAHHGIQLDTCAGADLGLTHIDVSGVTLPFASVGPSLELRGELGAKLAVALRGVAGLNIARPSSADVETPLWSGRLELALSWRLR